MIDEAILKLNRWVHLPALKFRAERKRLETQQDLFNNLVGEIGKLVQPLPQFRSLGAGFRGFFGSSLVERKVFLDWLALYNSANLT